MIADYEITQQMLSYFIGQTRSIGGFHRYLSRRPRVVVCVPSGVPRSSCGRSGGSPIGGGTSRVHHRGTAAAIGAGLPVNEPRGSMIVDVGGGTTEVAVIPWAHRNQEIGQVAGNDMDAAISAYIQRELSVGTQTAEQLKIEIGSALPLPEETAAEIRGRDHVTGLPKTVVISSEEVREAISTPLDAIVAAVVDTLDRTPPELASDIMDVDGTGRRWGTPQRPG